MSASAQRLAVWHQAKSIVDSAAAERRELTASERCRLDSHLARIDAMDNATAPIAEWRSLVAPSDPPKVDPMSNVSTFIRSGGTGATTVPYEPREVRALNTVTGSAGGNTVPTDFVRSLWTHFEARSPILSAARVFTTVDGRDLEVPVLGSYGSAVSVAEGSTIAGTDPTFDKVTLNARKYAQLLRVSNELLADNGVSIESYLGEIFASAVDELVGPLYAFGGGTTEPQGYASGAGTTITGGTGVAGAFTYNDLADMLGALEPNHQRSAVYMMSPSAVTTLRKMTDLEGRPLWSPAVTAGDPATLFGRPVITDPHLAPVGIGGTAVVAVDPSAYAVRIVEGLEVDRSADAFFSSDETAFRAILRTDADYLSDSAAVAFVGGTA